jgi:hypothetical protein
LIRDGYRLRVKKTRQNKNLERDPESAQRFSRATNAERVCAEIKQEAQGAMMIQPNLIAHKQRSATAMLRSLPTRNPRSLIARSLSETISN